MGIAAARGLARLKVKRLDEVTGCGQQAPSEECRGCKRRVSGMRGRGAGRHIMSGVWALGVGRREAGWSGW